MTKSIKRGPLTTVRGKPLKLPAWDEDGAPVPGMDGKPQLVVADALMLLESAVMGIPRELIEPKDPHRVQQMMYHLDKQRDGDGDVELPDFLYDWLRRLLDRPLTLTKEAKEANVHPPTYAIWRWGLDAAWLSEQLTDVDRRRTLAELAEVE